MRTHGTRARYVTDKCRCALVAHADVHHASWCPLLLARNRRNN